MRNLNLTINIFPTIIYDVNYCKISFHSHDITEIVFYGHIHIIYQVKFGKGTQLIIIQAA